MDSKHDPAFLKILYEENNITNFLNAFFGFLCRCTDFYVESTPDQRLGFPPGIAEKLVLNSLLKWKNMKIMSESPTGIKCPPPATEEVVVTSEESTFDSSNLNLKEDAGSSDVKNSSKSLEPSVSDSYNGASYENYRWSQSISDLDVIVPTPPTALHSKDLQVVLSTNGLKVSILKSCIPKNKDSDRANENNKDVTWETLVEGKFLFKIKSSESYWCLESGKHVNLHLQKISERWWDSLLENEPKITLNKIDCSRNLEEMGENEQMKVEELMWNQRRKLLGQPTSEQMRMEKILRQAWNADGSPFKGTEYDPSILKFN